ncbi:MAG: GNAT family N-acetyltransferase [Rickettsiales bacterium]|jgi:RimJ/RimL family protein N-acetyltransferase|nr:GNAT family N-acetyltransferase [Rickettsiales bacterium]
MDILARVLYDPLSKGDEMQKTSFPHLIKGEKVELRRPVADRAHAEALFDVISRNGFFYPWRFSLSSIRSAEDALYFIQKRAAKMDAGTDAYYDIFALGRYAGEVYARDFDFDNDTVKNFGYFMDKDLQGRGYASDAVSALGKYLFFIGVHRICLFTHYFDEKEPNFASERVARKCGFAFEGTARGAIFDPIGRRYGNEHMFAKLSTDS